MKLIKKEKEKSEAIIRDYETYNKVHNEVVKSMENKSKSTDEQNKHLKDYIIKMREQLNRVRHFHNSLKDTFKKADFFSNFCHILFHDIFKLFISGQRKY